MRSIIAAALLSFALATPAFAAHCPADAAAIDAALAKGPQLSAQQKAEVTKRRAEGEAFHKAGKHKQAVDTLAKAMAILGIR
jgi:hypothetical protein